MYKIRSISKKKLCQFYDYIPSNTAFLIFIAAFSIRLNLVLLFPDLVPESPDKLHRDDPIAWSLARGEGFAIRGNPTAIAAPMYPFFLSAIYILFGYSTTVLRIFLSLVDAGHCLLLYIIAKRYFSEKIPILTAITLIFCPYFIYPIFYVGTETLFVFFHSLFIFSISNAFQKKESRGFLISGILIGITTLCRAVSLLLPFFILPIFVILYKKNIKKGFLHFAIFLFGFTFVITPWIVRNYVVFHRFVPVQTLGGYHLFMATFDRNDHDQLLRDRARIQKSKGAIERDHLYYRNGLKRIMEDPRKFLNLMGRRFLSMWYTTHSGRYESFLLFANSILLFLAVTGIVISRRKWRDLLQFLAVIIYYIILHMIFVAILRYILHIIPILTIFAMITINKLFNIIIQIKHNNDSSEARNRAP